MVVTHWGFDRLIALDSVDFASGRGEALTEAERGANAIAQANVLAGEVALEVGGAIFEVMGARSATADQGFDRFWRNVRTRTLHNPAEYKTRNVGVSQDDGRPLPLDLPLKDIKTNSAHSQIEWMRKSVTDREATVGDLARLVSRRSPRFVGAPEQIADQLVAWQEAGIDGVNVINWYLPGSYEDFADHVMPTLRKRGLAKREYRPGTLRNKLFGYDKPNELPPAARYRGAFSGQEFSSKVGSDRAAQET